MSQWFSITAYILHWFLVVYLVLCCLLLTLLTLLHVFTMDIVERNIEIIINDTENLKKLSQCVVAVWTRHIVCIITIDRYVPTWFWGKSGHVQTILYGKMGRVDSPMPRGSRCAKLLADGATITYDIFEPLGNLETGGQWTFVVLLMVLLMTLVCHYRVVYWHG